MCQNFDELFSVLDSLRDIPSKTYGKLSSDIVQTIINEYRSGHRPWSRDLNVLPDTYVLRDEVLALILMEGSGRRKGALRKEKLPNARQAEVNEQQRREFLELIAQKKLVMRKLKSFFS